MGRDLSQGRFKPLFQELNRIGSWSPKYHTAALIPRTKDTGARISQGIELGHQRVTGSNHLIAELCSRYGALIDSRLAQDDLFYAIHPLLRIAVATELSFLSLVEARLNDEFDPSTLRGRDFHLSTLLHTKALLTHRIHGLESNVRFITGYKNLDWPKASNESAGTVKRIAEELGMDFQHLVALSKTLITRCNDSISLIQAVTTVRQAERAMEESRSLKRLTILAFFFVPLSFTTGLFGMNFKELADQNGNRLSIWVWVIVAIPLTLISLVPLLPATHMALQALSRRRTSHKDSDLRFHV